jgi:hypothetical protein
MIVEKIGYMDNTHEHSHSLIENKLQFSLHYQQDEVSASDGEHFPVLRSKTTTATNNVHKPAFHFRSPR